VLRAYNAGQDFDEKQALAWTATLGQLDTKGQKVYFMPWNEPNQDGEASDFNSAKPSYEYVKTLKQYLTEAGLLNTKVVLLSPMVNKTHPNFTNDQFFQKVSKQNYYGLAAGSSINEYDSIKDSDYCQASDDRKNNCKYDQIGIPSPYYALEAGVADSCTGAPCYKDDEIAKMLNTSFSEKWDRDSSFKMFAVFSYDPLRNKTDLGDTQIRKNWDIFSASKVKSFYQAQCNPGGVSNMNGFDEKKFNQWLTKHSGELIKCNDQCGYAPKDRPGLCSGVGKNSDELGYDKSRFDDYDVDSEKFYIQPIKGLTPVNKKNPSLAELYQLTKGDHPQRRTAMIQQDLIKQGYQAVCATPAFKIELTDIGKKWMKSYLKSQNVLEGTAFGAGELKHKEEPTWNEEGRPFYSDLTLDVKGALYPVFRDVTDKRFLMTSLEEFFGYKDKVDEYSTTEIYSGAINSLATQTQRCAFGAINLAKQEVMCQKLENKGDCALYDRPIPHTNKTIEQAVASWQFYVDSQRDKIEKLQNAPADYRDGKTALTACGILLDPKASSREKELAELLLNTPLTIDRGYRLAFLVTKIELKYPNGVSSFFNMFIHPNAGFFEGGPGKPPHAVLVVAFKIPDITTDKGQPGEDLGNTYWSDPADLTKKSLLTTKQQQKNNEKDIEKVQSLLDASRYYLNNTQTKQDKIFCSVTSDPNSRCQGTIKPEDEFFCEMLASGGVGSPRCNDPLSRSLVNIINAQAKLSKAEPDLFPSLDCEEVTSETSDTIDDPVSLEETSSADKVFKKEFGYDLLNQLFTDSSHYIDETDELSAMVATTGDANRGDRGWLDSHGLGHEVSGHEQDFSNTVGWGLKSIFYVIPEMEKANWPYSSCCDPLTVEQYLVYPEGYNLKTIESVLAGSFFSQKQLAKLMEEEKDYDLIQGSNDQTTFNGAKLNKSYDDYSLDPPNWHPDSKDPACAHEEVVGFNRAGKSITKTVYHPPCKRTLTAKVGIKGKLHNTSYLGGKLGFWLRKIQQTLNSSTSAAWEYFDSCQTTEDFLLGRCQSGNQPEKLENKDPNCTALSCGGTQATDEKDAVVSYDDIPPINYNASEHAIVQCPYDTQSDTRKLGASIEVYKDRSWKLFISYDDCELGDGAWGDIAFSANIVDENGESILANSNKTHFEWPHHHSVLCGRKVGMPCDGPKCTKEEGYGTKVKPGVQKICASGFVKSNNKDDQCAGTMTFQVCRNIPPN